MYFTNISFSVCLYKRIQYFMSCSNSWPCNNNWYSDSVSPLSVYTSVTVLPSWCQANKFSCIESFQTCLLPDDVWGHLLLVATIHLAKQWVIEFAGVRAWTEQKKKQKSNLTMWGGICRCPLCTCLMCKKTQKQAWLTFHFLDRFDTSVCHHLPLFNPSWLYNT